MDHSRLGRRAEPGHPPQLSPGDGAGSKLLIVERPLPPGNEPALDAILGDITMLVSTGGRERTEAEYRALLEAADLRLERTVGTGTPFSVLEAAPT